MLSQFSIIGLSLWFLFMAITFGYSATEKLWDYKGTIGYYQSYFSIRWISKILPILIPLIIIVELIITILYGFGIYNMIVNAQPEHGLWASAMGSLLMIVFLIGQRIAKDYEGASRILLYFMACCLPLLYLGR